MPKEYRTLFFVDGFNVYHALDNPNLSKYKWLNYWALSEKFLRGRDTLVGVLYFTAYTPWDAEKRQRHETLVSANRAQGVDVILGEFRRTQKRCRADCRKLYTTYEEKRTDVNIAVNLFQRAVADEYDKAVLISGDSDMIPSVEAVQKVFPKKELSVVIPIGRRAKELKQVIGASMKMKESHLRTSQLPENLELRDGTMLRKPLAWNNK